MSKSDREDAERYRQSLVSYHEQLVKLREHNDDLLKQVAFLKQKRRELTRQVKQLTGDPQAPVATEEVKDLRAELRRHQLDLKMTAKDLQVSMPAPGSDMARVLRILRALRIENEALRERLQKQKPSK